MKGHETVLDGRKKILQAFGGAVTPGRFVIEHEKYFISRTKWVGSLLMQMFFCMCLVMYRFEF